jgi:hypothetical protein
MIFGRDDACQRRADRGAVDLRQDGVEGRAFPVAGDKNGDVFLIEPGMPGRSSQGVAESERAWRSTAIPPPRTRGLA